MEKFQSPSDTREFIMSHAEPVVSHLSQHGYLDTLPRLSATEVRSADDTQQGVVKLTVKDGDVGVRLQLNIIESNHEVTLHATELGQSHAVVTPDDDNPFVISQRGDDVEPQRFCKRDGSICVSNFTCGDTQVNEYERIVCTDGDCFKGDDLGCGMPLFINCKRC